MSSYLTAFPRPVDRVGLDGDEVPDSAYDMGGGFGAADDESASDGEDPDSGGDDGGLRELMERIEENVRLTGKDTDTGDERSVDGGGEVGSCVEPDLTGLDNEGYDDFQGDVDSGGGPEEPEVYLPPHDGGGAPPAIPRLDMLHTMAPSFAQSRTVEGGPENLRHNTKATGSPFYPFATKEQQLIYVWQHVHHISQKALGGLLEILLMEYEGERFDVRGLAGVNPEHFNSRMRPYLPLLQLLERDVPSAHDGKTSAVVYDLPVNLLLDRVMQLQSETALSETYPGGKLLRGDEAAQNSLTSDHVNCVPTRSEGNVRNSNHNGTLVRSTPFYGIDGIRARICGRKVYVHDCCICDVEGVASLCRILELFYDAERREVAVTVRLFRLAAEVRDVGEEERRGPLVRSWEDCTPGNELELKAADVLGLAEVYTPHEFAAGQHSGDGGQVGLSFPWERFVGEGFVKKAGKKRRQQGDAVPKPFKVSESPWSKEGTAEKPLFGLRCEGVHLNDMNLPFFSAPMAYFNDAFNAFGLGNKVRECFQDAGSVRKQRIEVLGTHSGCSHTAPSKSTCFACCLHRSAN